MAVIIYDVAHIRSPPHHSPSNEQMQWSANAVKQTLPSTQEETLIVDIP